jgi:hypothetical protein
VGRRLGVALVGLVALSFASCGPCSLATPQSGSSYSVDTKCGGTIMASDPLLPTALSSACTGAGACFTSLCLPKTSTCTDVCFVDDSDRTDTHPADLVLSIAVKLPAPGASTDSVTLPDPSVTVVAKYSDGSSDPPVPFNVVGGSVTLKLAANDFTSTYSLRLMNAAGQEIDIQNGSYTAHGHEEAVCQSN